MSTVLVCGSRDFDDYKAIRKRLSQLPKGTRIVHGAARGADELAGVAARSLGFLISSYPADWKGLGRRAGVVRNQRMLDEEDVSLVLAFPKGDLPDSKGTADMVRRAIRVGIRYEIIERVQE